MNETTRPTEEVDHLENMKREHAQKTFFLQAFAPSPFHWHFQQAYDALAADLYLPGISGLLNGIEASLRTTVSEIEGRGTDEDLGTLMSNNSLLRSAETHGMDISLLAFPGEIDFREKLPTRDGVRLVKLRNDICHGNFQKFSREVEGQKYFTPECLGEVSAQLLQISFNWARFLCDFRHSKGFGVRNSKDLITPENPLAQWLMS